MPRRPWTASALLLVLLAAPPVRADDLFDYYTNPVLSKALTAEGVKELKALTDEQIGDNDRVLKNLSGALVIVKTNDSRLAKLLVLSARRKISSTKSLPIVLVERYVTYREGEERAVHAEGKGLSLFHGFRLSLDIGQVVPEEVGGDLRCVVDGDKVTLEPVGKAKLYLVTRALPDVEPKKGPRLVVGEKFDPKYYNGTYHLYDDGRRSGKLTLKVDDDGSVSGAYYSDRDGTKYEVRGKVGTPAHSIEFTVQLPRVEQTFKGWLFTGDGQFLTGSSRLNDREAGFYARRIEE
jgi:hypothetical protein